MPNQWVEGYPHMDRNEFEIYEYSGEGWEMVNYHVHDFYEVLVILHGRSAQYTEETVVEMKPGDIRIYPPGVFHRGVTLREHGKSVNYVRLMLYLRADFVRSLDHEWLHFSSILDNFGQPADRYLSLPLHEAKLLCQPMEEIIRADRDDDPLCHFANRAQVMLFLYHIAQAILQPGAVIRMPENHSLIPRVLAYINTHLDENLSLDNLASHFFVNKFYLSHQFKQYTQLSVHRYVLTRRMMHAQMLLREGCAPSDVSKACGYHEYSSFYKAFLRTTGKPPSDFRS